MRLIPVIDLLGGKVVRAVAGRRSEYRPLVSSLCPESEPAQLALEFARRYSPPELYIADLDAIQDRGDNSALWWPLTEVGPQLWIDAGISTAEQATAYRDEFAAQRNRPRWILGLESIASHAELKECIRQLGSESSIFSLDLQNGVPRAVNAGWQTRSPEEIAAEVVALGVERLIVLDLADVGVAGGTRTLDLCRRLRQQHPRIELIAGGGVRDLEDLRRLEQSGCDAALVATALHEGRL